MHDLNLRTTWKIFADRLFATVIQRNHVQLRDNEMKDHAR